MSSRIRCLIAALVGTVLAAPVIAQPSPLTQIPGKSPIVVQVRGWDRTLDRIKASVKAAAPDHAENVIGHIETGVTMLLMGRELKGLAKDGPMFLVFTDVPGGDDSRDMAVVAKVTNYVQFRDAFLKDDEKKDLKAKQGYETTKIENEEVFLIDRESYAIVALSEKALKLFLDKKADTLASKLDKTLAGKLLDADVSAYVDVKAITKQYGDQIDSFKTLMDQSIQQLQTTGMLGKDQLEMAKKLYEGLFQLVEDSDGFVASLDFRPEGYMLRLHTHVAEKSKTNELLRTFKPAALEALTKLPTGQMSYITGTADLDWLKNLMQLMTMGAGGGGSAGEDSKSFADAARALSDLKAEGWSLSSDFPAAGLQVYQYKDGAKAADATLKLYRALPENGAFGAGILKGKPEIKTDVEKMNGFSFHSVKIAWDFDKSLEKYPEELREFSKPTLKLTLGDGLNLWFGTDGKSFLQATAKDWAAAKKLFEGYFQGKETLAGNTSYQATRKQLPADANLLMMIDANRYGYYMAKTIGEMMKNFGAPGGGAELKSPEGKPSYIGLAVGLQPRHGTLDIWVPVDAVKVLIKTLEPVFGGLDR